MLLNRFENTQSLKLLLAAIEDRAGKKIPHDSAELKHFLDLVSSIPEPTIPLLSELAALAGGTEGKTAGIITRRINRCYLRLCRIQEELGKLDLRKAATPGTALEDYVFSQIDFSQYREMDEKHFETLVPEGLTDFDETFLQKTFGLGRREILSVIEESYIHSGELYRLRRDNPLILSIMRTLESSLENLPLFNAREIQKELKNLVEYNGRIQGTELLFRFLVNSLDDVLITHDDGMTTKLFVSPQGDLSGTFRPGNKPWTRILIPFHPQSQGGIGNEEDSLAIGQGVPAKT